jgi:hypothetical protein
VFSQAELVSMLLSFSRRDMETKCGLSGEIASGVSENGSKRHHKLATARRRGSCMPWPPSGRVEYQELKKPSSPPLSIHSEKYPGAARLILLTKFGGILKITGKKKRQEKKNKVFIPPPYQPNAFKETEMYQ